MDPNANLREQLELVASLRESYEAEQGLDEVDVMRLVDLVEALDGWLRKGGFLPRHWEPVDEHWRPTRG